MMVKLNVAIRVPEEAPREFDLSFDKTIITIGRDKENDIQIPLSTVSRRHARIVKEGGDWLVEDLNSTHGTKVNGQNLGLGGKRLLHEGDQIEIVYAFIIFFGDHDINLNDMDITDEKTSVVAQKLVKEAVNNLDSNDDVAHLMIMNGPKQGQTIKFGPSINEIIFGRGEDADVRLDDVNVSRKHAVFIREHNQFFVADMSSKNGVLLNGKKIDKKTAISDADEIEIGSIRLIFVDPQAHILSRLGEMSAFAAEKSVAQTDNNVLAANKEAKAKENIDSSASVVGTVTNSKTNSVTGSEFTYVAAGKKFGAAEYVLLTMLGLVVVGLIVGVVVALT